jgi:ribosome-associated protein
MKLITIKTEFIKLDQLLKYADLVQSGGEAKLVIKQGLVMVNEVICTERGKKIRTNDTVTFDGITIKIQ